MKLEPLEAAVLEMLLAGDHPVLNVLREQLRGLSVRHREFSGTGFFAQLEVSPAQAAAPLNALRFGDVAATIEGLAHGAGFVLFVDQGLLHMLEGYSYEEPWPEQIEKFSLHYLHPDRSGELAKLR